MKGENRSESKPRVKTKQVNTAAFDVRTALYSVLGVDLTEIATDRFGLSRVSSFLWSHIISGPVEP